MERNADRGPGVPYTIQILNNSGTARSYVVFTAPPAVMTTGDDQPVIYTNAWATFESITDGGFDSLGFTDDVYAFWGTTPDTLGPGVEIASGGTAWLDVTGGDSVPFSGAASVGFGKVISPGYASPGAFGIIVSGDFAADDGYLFGLAKAGRTPIPQVVASFAAPPGNNVFLAPRTKVYVAAGDFRPGEVLDVSHLSADCAVVDFSGRPQTTATAIQGADGRWAVDYSA